jgi:DNA-binding NarL/FixJ family response regulator
MDDAQRIPFKEKRPAPAERAAASPARGKQARTERVRIVIADDDPMSLEELGNLLQTQFDTVGRAENGKQLIECVHRLRPAVVVTDLSMPEMNGIEAARQISKTHPDVKVLILSVHSGPAFVEAAFEGGAKGYVVKLEAGSDLIPAIEDVLAGRLHRPRGLI